MSTPIANLPTTNSLTDTHLLIVESRNVADTASIETEKTNLNSLYNWLSDNIAHTYYAKLDQLVTDNNNLIKAVNTVNNQINLEFRLPEWDNTKEYSAGAIVRYNNCIYTSIDVTTALPTSTDHWIRIGYIPGRQINISETNEISSIGGIEVWQANTHYERNYFVIKDKKLFQCTVANTDTVWTKSHWQNIGEGNGIIPYENNKLYDADSIVLYNNRLYKRLSSGADIAWNPNNWVCISNGDYSQVYIKYSHNEPTSNADMKDVPDAYIGIYVGSSETAPTSYTQYVWYKFRGDDGNVNVEANTIVIYVTLDPTEWSSEAPYTQTINNAAFKDYVAPIIDLDFDEDSSNWQSQLDDFSFITKADCTNGAMTFYCLASAPQNEVALKIRINGDVNASSFVTKTEFNELKAMIGEANTELENLIIVVEENE